MYIFYAVLLQAGARCHTRLVKPVRLQPHCCLVLRKQLHLPHTNTNVQDERRQTFSLCRLYASADPALIQQTKLSLLNAQQKSSLAVIMHPPRPAAPQSTVLPAPPDIHQPHPHPLYTLHKLYTPISVNNAWFGSCGASMDQTSPAYPALA